MTRTSAHDFSLCEGLTDENVEQQNCCEEKEDHHHDMETDIRLVKRVLDNVVLTSLS